MSIELFHLFPYRSTESHPPAHHVYEIIKAEAQTPVDPLRCPFCSRLLSPLLLTYHIQQHKDEPAQKPCPICGKSAEYLFGHMENHQADLRRVAAAVAGALAAPGPDAPAPNAPAPNTPASEAQAQPAVAPTKVAKKTTAGKPSHSLAPAGAQAVQVAVPVAPVASAAQTPAQVLTTGGGGAEDRKASVARLQGITWPAAQWPQGLGAEEKLSELFRCLQEWRAEAEVGNQKEFPSAKERRPDDLGRLQASLLAIIRSSQSMDANRWREVARQTEEALQILGGDHYPGEDELGPELDRKLVQSRLAVSQSVRIATLNGSHVVTKQFLANDSSYSQTLRELQISLTVKHPNIAQGLGWYRDTDGMVVLVTQLYGPNLATVVRALLPSGSHCHRHAMAYHTQPNNNPHPCDYRFLNGRLPWLQAKTFLLQAAAGLSYLHRERIFHRDFGAHNLVLTANWDSVVIIDFGLSTRAKGEYTTGSVDSRAKSPFMSPSRFSRALAHSNSGEYTVDLETRVQDDLWPLACVLNFLLDPVQPWFAEPETARKALPDGPRPLPERFAAELRKLAAPDPQCRDVAEFKTKLERIEFLVPKWEDYSLAWLPAPQPAWASPAVLPNFYTRGSWPDGREVRHSEEAFLEFKGQLLTYLQTCSLCGALGKPDHKQCRELKKSQSAEFDQLEKIRAHLTRVVPLWNNVSDIQTGPMGARAKEERAEGQPKKPKSFGPPDLTREVRLLAKIVRDMYKMPPALRRPAVKDKPEADRPPINWDSNGRRSRAWGGLRPPSLSLAASFAGGRLQILGWLDQAFRVDWFGNLICPFSLNNSQCFADVDHVWPWKLGGSSHEHPSENDDKPYNLTMLHFRANRNVKSDVPLQFLNPADLQTGYSTLQAVHLLNMDSGPRLLPFLLGWDPAQADHGYQPPKHLADCFDLDKAMAALTALANFELKKKAKPAGEKPTKAKKKSVT